MDKRRMSALLNNDKLRRLYANTYYGLADRLDSDGYLEESYVPGRYPGDFTRSSAAYALLMADTGEVEKAERALRFVLDTMKRHKMTRPPHVMTKLRHNPDGSVYQEVDTVNQLDGTGHILMACGELILCHGRTSLVEDYWEYLSWVLDHHIQQPYFFGNEICNFPVAKLHLFLNTAFEHSREGRYWCCFDLLTQSFLGSALERFAKIAANLGKSDQAERWNRCLCLLKAGIEKSLTFVSDGKLCYSELRIPDSNDGVPFDGMGWVNLSPIAARWEALDQQVLHNTALVLRQKLWREDPLGTYRYLDKDTLPDGTPCFETIGKGVGWDIEIALRMGDYAHICDQLEFLMARHEADVYGECMFFCDGSWHSRDNGNGEQCIWWCMAMAKLRNAVGLPAVPDRRDVTERPAVPDKFELI